VTDFIVVTSGPSSDWPKKAYRNPTDQLVKFLDYKHGENWAIFEFRAEGTGYPDSEVYDRIHHYPWPDHHPPPFALIPNLMASMRNWLHGDEEQEKTAAANSKRRVAVVHCKAGKGRSGTVASSYLISQEGWSRPDALKRFTERRMRAGFGEGVSIPSQLRYVRYVDEWANKMNKQYVERPVEILELHVWGLRDGVKVTVHSYIEDGRRIQCFHTFNREEKVVIETGNVKGGPSQAPDKASAMDGDVQPNDLSYPSKSQSAFSFGNSWAFNVSTVIFKPSTPLVLPTSDINIDFERRNHANYTGWTVVTSLAHVWFNAYFEGGYTGADSGICEIDWEAMDGIKGSAKKGIKALDKLKVVWRYPKRDGTALGKVITEPAKGEPVQEPEAADWKGEKTTDGTAEVEATKSGRATSGRQGGAALTMGASIAVGADSLTKELGLRKEAPESTNISRANSIKGERAESPMWKSNELQEADRHEEDEGVRALGPNGEEHIVCDDAKHGDEIEGQADTTAGKNYEKSIGKVAHAVSKMRGNDDHGSAKD
jgi:protein-tyrosine phosphatase